MVAVRKELGAQKFVHQGNIPDYIGGTSSQKVDSETQIAVYKDALSLVERLHRQLLDVVKDDLDRAGHEELTPVQALLVYNIGKEEWSAGELRSKGCYLGSNVSYNLKKLHELKYVESKKSPYDKRQIKLKLTENGRDVCDQLEAMFERQAKTLAPSGGIEHESLVSASKTLNRLERFWSDQVKYHF